MIGHADDDGRWSLWVQNQTCSKVDSVGTIRLVVARAIQWYVLNHFLRSKSRDILSYHAEVEGTIVAICLG